jgi:hypothetical protein
MPAGCATNAAHYWGDQRATRQAKVIVTASSFSLIVTNPTRLMPTTLSEALPQLQRPVSATTEAMPPTRGSGSGFIHYLQSFIAEKS